MNEWAISGPICLGCSRKATGFQARMPLREPPLGLVAGDPGTGSLFSGTLVM